MLQLSSVHSQLGASHHSTMSMSLQNSLTLEVGRDRSVTLVTKQVKIIGWHLWQAVSKLVTDTLCLQHSWWLPSKLDTEKTMQMLQNCWTVSQGTFFFYLTDKTAAGRHPWAVLTLTNILWLVQECRMIASKCSKRPRICTATDNQQFVSSSQLIQQQSPTSANGNVTGTHQSSVCDVNPTHNWGLEPKKNLSDAKRLYNKVYQSNFTAVNNALNISNSWKKFQLCQAYDDVYQVPELTVSASHTHTNLTLFGVADNSWISK